MIDIVEKLREFGVDIFEGKYEVESKNDIVEEILSCEDARLKLSLPVLFIANPKLSDIIKNTENETIKYLYTAAVYLQNLWKTYIEMKLGKCQELPDLFSKQMGLPPPDELHGKTGLFELSEKLKEKTGFSYEDGKVFEKFLKLFLEKRKFRD